MTFDEFLQSPELATLGAIMLDESKKRTQRKYSSLNRLAKPGQLVMVGDSIVEGFPLQEFFREPMYNRGISGDTSGEMLRRLPDTVLPLKPKMAMLWVGTNDLQDEIPIETICANVEAAAESLEKACGSRIVILSVAPVNTASTDPTIRNTVGKRSNTAIEALNARYRKLCEDKGWLYLDIYPCLACEGSLAEELSEDGLHPNIAGYIPVAKEIAAILSQTP